MKRLARIFFAMFFLSAVALSLPAGRQALSVAYAEVPHLLNYQGRLTDSSGKPLADGAQAITFRIYDAETAGNLLWEETQSITIQKGIFNVLLGSVTNLNLTFDKPYFLEIKVGTEVMNPRQRITSAGYAIRAEKADQATTAQSADLAQNAKKADVANEIKGIENIFSGSGNIGIGTTTPLAKLDVQNGAVKLKGIFIDHVTGLNPPCLGGEGAVLRKWSQQTYSSGNPYQCTSCTTGSGGWAINPPTCEYECCGAETCNKSTFASAQWTEAICMGN